MAEDKMQQYHYQQHQHHPQNNRDEKLACPVLQNVK
jgi:hypothetical protein